MPDESAAVAELREQLAVVLGALAQRDAVIGTLRAELAAATVEIAELRRQLGQNSRNSSKPPSSDGPATPAPRSLRRRGARNPAGRTGTRDRRWRRSRPRTARPPGRLDPDAKRARLRIHRRAMQMVLRLLAYNAEHWLATALNTYLQDPDEYRAITRNLLHLGGAITYATHTITVTLDRPPAPRLTHALRLLLDEFNTSPPRLPGDARPISYRLNSA